MNEGRVTATELPQLLLQNIDECMFGEATAPHIIIAVSIRAAVK